MTKGWTLPGARGCHTIVMLLAVSLAGGCGSGTAQRRDATLDRRMTSDGRSADSAGAHDGAGESGPWRVQAEESFEQGALGTLSWAKDTYPDDGPFSDNGVFFRNRGVTPPVAYRASAPFGAEGWLTIETYSRSQATNPADLVSVVDDPSGAANRVLRLRSPAHTDATVIRSTQPLPANYRVSLRVGYAAFGDGQQGNNGYDSGNERAEPWLSADATEENGFYWLAILDAIPRPHNNVWSHHHRKVTIDSDNHYSSGGEWMEIFNGTSFEPSGAFPVMMFVVDGKGEGATSTGKPFYSYAAGKWQASGFVRAVDAYKPDTWYQVSIERRGDSFTIQIKGDFRYGGQKTYTATLLNAAVRCIWHYNNEPLPAESPCIDTSSYDAVGDSYPNWPADQGWPDYFMFGDPHNNYYEGVVYYDDVRLEVLR